MHVMTFAFDFFLLLYPIFSFSAGCVALPALINIKAVIEQRQCTGVWNQKDELPVSTIYPPKEEYYIVHIRECPQNSVASFVFLEMDHYLCSVFSIGPIRGDSFPPVLPFLHSCISNFL